MKVRILFPVLMALLLGLALQASAANVTPPPGAPSPGAPSWWNSEAYDLWGYYYRQLDPAIQESEANFPKFGVTVDNVGTTFILTVSNVHIPWNWKRFFFYVEGTGATGVPTWPENPVTGGIVGQPGPTIVLGATARVYNPGNGTWLVAVNGIAKPQPDWLRFTWTVPGSSWSRVWVGETCAVPEPGSLLALGTGLMGLVGLALRRRR